MIDNETFGTRRALYHTFGCKLNFAETSTVARQLAERGIVRVQEGESPDIIVVNTCSVTELADKKCRQTIRSFHRRYPEATIVVTGCYAQLKSEEVLGIEGVDIVAGNDRKALLGSYIDTWMAEHQPLRMITATADIDTFTPSCSRGDRTRYFLKVQDGCDYRCSYCTIPAARGHSRSGTIAQLTEQARAVAAEGGKEIVITGVNIGDFGRLTGETFHDLCEALNGVDGIERYRISSIEPNLLTDEIIDKIAHRWHRFMPHFHIPLQSGNDEVLKLMRRRYNTSLFRSKVEKIRRLIPDAFIGVDLITGARGETLERFEASRQFIESLDISRLHVFPYSERPGTDALALDHVVSQAEKQERARQMIALSEKKLAEFTGRFAGTVRPVLIEHPRHDGTMEGFTDNYLRVTLARPDASLSNTIVNMRLEPGTDSETLIATPAE